MHSYFTKELSNKGIDLNSIHFKKQLFAKNEFGLNYGLNEIVSWIKESTANFQESNSQFIELDNKIKDVVFAYYEDYKMPNPFIPVTREQIEQDISALEVMVTIEPDNEEIKSALDGLKLYLQLENPTT